MGNMSYCRYTNTLHDLQDCFGDGSEAEPVTGQGGMTAEERENRQRIVEMAKNIVEAYGDFTEEEWAELDADELDADEDEE